MMWLVAISKKPTVDCWDTGTADCDTRSLGSQHSLHLPAEELEAVVCCLQACCWSDPILGV